MIVEVLCITRQLRFWRLLCMCLGNLFTPMVEWIYDSLASIKFNLYHTHTGHFFGCFLFGKLLSNWKRIFLGLITLKLHTRPHHQLNQGVGILLCRVPWFECCAQRRILDPENISKLIPQLGIFRQGLMPNSTNLHIKQYLWSLLSGRSSGGLLTTYLGKPIWHIAYCPLRILAN